MTELVTTSYIPAPFGLNNTGVICYMNAFLQSIASCPYMTQLALTAEGKEYLKRTRTGSAYLDYVQAFSTGGVNPSVGPMSANILQALRTDLQTRQNKVNFGRGQESASEALILFLDMIEPDLTPEEKTVGVKCPFTCLFQMRHRCHIYCPNCEKNVSSTADNSVMLNLFGDQSGSTPEEFANHVRKQQSVVTDYQCEQCNKKIDADRLYYLSLAPEIIYCSFNVYGVTDKMRSQPRTSHYFPENFDLPGIGGSKRRYRLMSQIEHSGGLNGGHYWARALRRSNEGLSVSMLNDNSASPSRFENTSGTYIIVYCLYLTV